MRTYISLLRGVNVSGQNRISMPDLAGVYKSLSLVKVTTYIQSGNVVFDSMEEDTGKIIHEIESGITRAFGVNVRVILRDQNQIKQIIYRNPYMQQRNVDPERIYVTFLSKVPTVLELSKLPLPEGNGDEFSIIDREVYLFCPNGYGKTKFSNTFFEKKLDLTATTRNWKTVRTLLEIANKR